MSRIARAAQASVDQGQSRDGKRAKKDGHESQKEC